MAKTIAGLKARMFRLKVKQHAAVLDFTDAVERRMGERGMSQQALASALDKSRSWISKIFRKKPNLTFFTAVELADALDMDVCVDVVPRAGAIVGEVFGHTHMLSACGVFHPANDSPATTAGITDMAA